MLLIERTIAGQTERRRLLLVGGLVEWCGIRLTITVHAESLRMMVLLGVMIVEHLRRVRVIRMTQMTGRQLVMVRLQMIVDRRWICTARMVMVMVRVVWQRNAALFLLHWIGLNWI